MYLHELALDTFVLMHADWTVAQARPLLNSEGITHVIIMRREPGETYYYLRRRDTARFILSRKTEQMSLREAFDLHEPDAREADAYADSSTIHEGVVILDEGQIVGFYDPQVPNSKSPLRGTIRGEQPQAAPQPVPRTLVAEFPGQAQLNTTVPLQVSLLISALASGNALPIALPVGAEVDIVVQPRSGFSVEGNSMGSLTVLADDEPLPLLFKLKATELGVGKVRVLAYHQSQPLGAITVAATIVPATEAVNNTVLSHKQTIEPARVHTPDLSLLILEQTNGGETSITVRLTATDPSLGLLFKPFGPVKLRSNAQEYFKEFFTGIENLPLATAEDQAVAERQLAAQGAQLFTTLLPSDLQVLLWNVRQRIKTVQILSDEPWIPWELCKLQGEENGTFEDGPYLCEDYAMTRWIPGMTTPSPTFSLKKVALVVPQDSGLSFAKDECDFMQSLTVANRQVERVKAAYLDVTNAMIKGEYDGWHFTGHGKFRDADPNGSAMELEDGRRLQPVDLNGRVRNLGKAKPLVFLNACQLGRNAFSLTNIGGWAPQFLRANAAAFVGAYWNVYDDSAYQFAREFYQQLFAGIPIGQAVNAARQKIKQSGDPTWLAYTVYADPLAVVAQ